jgi:glycosyltransferase involved in cell wall biosynthesis
MAIRDVETETTAPPDSVPGAQAVPTPARPKRRVRPSQPEGRFVSAAPTATPDLTIVVPCYNEENAVANTVAELRRALPTTNYELILVNDGSTDRSAEIMKDIERTHERVRVIHHRRNRGYGAALKTAIRQARAEFIAITDADGTYPNERLPELLALAREADMVVGARTAADAEYPLVRKIPKAFLRFYASWIAGRNIPDLNSGMRVFRRSLAQRFLNILPDGFSFTSTITLAMLTNYHDVRYVPIAYASRVGRSKIHPIRDTVNFVQLIVRIGTYFAPLRVFFPIALVLFLLFGACLAYDTFVLRNLTDKTIMLLLFALNTGMFALLADMIDKRSAR